MFDPDKPIECTNEEDCKRKDKLRRWDYSKKLGEAILKYDSDESLVIGLEGQWGHGKTSIINMALTHVKSSGTEDEEPIVFIFNPWYFSNQNQLIQKFFDEFKIVLNNYVDDSGLKSKIDSLINRLIPPVIGLAAIVDPTRTEALMHNVQSFEGDPSSEESLESIKKDINEIIQSKINSKIVIIIDDIDRLTPLEIKQIFKLVKLIADFPKTVYILSFDKEVIVKALNDKNSKLGEQYLQKIIQIPFEVPKINKVDIEEVLFQQIDEIIIDSDNFDQTHWWNLYSSALKYYFNSIRDVKLYINALKFNYSIIKNEVNTADFLAILTIQLFENDIYKSIRDNKDFFAGEYDINHLNEARIQQRQSQFDEILGKAHDENMKEPLRQFLNYMFPKFRNHGSDWLREWRRTLRICSPDKFDAYFNLSIPKNEISQEQIESILLLSNDIPSFSSSLDELGDKIIRFLERFEDFTHDFPIENIQNVISVFMDKGDFFPDKQTEFLGFNTSMRVLRIIHQLIFRYSTFDERFSIIKNAIESSENGLYIAVRLVSVEDQRQGKYGLRETPRPDTEWTVSSDQLIRLEQMVSEKIELWASDGRLSEHKKLIQIMFAWRRWKPEEMSEFMSELLREDNGYIKFISLFKEKRHSYSTTDQVSRSKWVMDFDNMSNLLNLDEFADHIRSIKSSHRFDSLDPDSKDLVDFFLNKFDDRNRT